MKVAVIGSGTYGIALSNLLSSNGHDVFMYTPFEAEALELNTHRENKKFLPGIKILDNITITTDKELVVSGAGIITIVIPSIFIRETIQNLKPFITDNQIITIASKGFEEEHLMTLSQVVESVLPNNPICALSGPTHAEELAREVPTACVAATPDENIAHVVQNVFMNNYFRIYRNNDLMGVELAGALKNVIALACGILNGLGYGDNTKAALMTRGLKEIADLGVAMGTDAATYSGLAGMGDLIVTCTSQHSRNMRAGTLIGKGHSLEETKKEIGMVIEGANAANAAHLLAQKHGVSLPIVSKVNAVLRGEQDLDSAIAELMTRRRTAE